VDGSEGSEYLWTVAVPRFAADPELRARAPILLVPLREAVRPMITARLEPLPPFDEEGRPEAWLVLSSRHKELRRFPGRDRRLAEAFATEFNISAYEADRRLRDAASAHRARRRRPGSDAAD
jgi:hypothetical protein